MGKKTFKNVQTGETAEVWNVSETNEGFIYKVSRGTKPGKAFFESYPFLIEMGENAEGNAILQICDPDWIPVKGKSQGIQTHIFEERTEETIKPAQPQPQQTAGTADPLAAFYSLFAGVENNVLNKVLPLIEDVAKKAAICTKIEVHTPHQINKVEGLTIDGFKKVVALLNEGQNVYLWGPAGTGKSYTARQAAQALNLDFYESSQVLYKHDVEGYGDANGNYIESQFYKAFVNGGLFMLDEMDSSMPEALIVLNDALANKQYSFPVVGLKTAHPDFRVVAAGNTPMTGATEEYTGRSVQDASSRDRFAFVFVDYDKNIEKAMANGDMQAVEFAHELRESAKKNNIKIVVSYRFLKTLTNPNLQDVFSDSELLESALFKGMETDEIRILYNGLQTTGNRWAKAAAELCKY